MSNVTEIPTLALSVRQPWAWAIIHAGKDIENRAWKDTNPNLYVQGPIAIHAAKGMTRDEYESAAHFINRHGFECPPPADLLRGGIIGSVTVKNTVMSYPSPWFFGPKGLILDGARPCDFIPSVGALGYFKWQRADASILPKPAKWMSPYEGEA